jgi:hypothetical protein
MRQASAVEQLEDRPRLRGRIQGRAGPPLHTRIKREVNPTTIRARRKELPALLVAALNQPIVATGNREWQQITKRDAVVAQLVDESTGVDLPRPRC